MNCRIKTQIKTQINNEHIVRTVFNKSDDKYVTFDTFVGDDSNPIFYDYDHDLHDRTTYFGAKAGLNHLAMCKKIIDDVSITPERLASAARLRDMNPGPIGSIGYVGSGCSAPPAVSGVTGPTGPQGPSVSGFTSCTYIPVGATGSIGPTTNLDKPKENDLHPAKKLIDRLNYFRKRERAYEK